MIFPPHESKMSKTISEKQQEISSGFTKTQLFLLVFAFFMGVVCVFALNSTILPLEGYYPEVKITSMDAK